MVTVATATSAGRITGRGLRHPGVAGRLLPTALPIAIGAGPVVALVLASGTVPLRGTAVIPIAGILIGGGPAAPPLGGAPPPARVLHPPGGGGGAPPPWP